jgi:signal transduction histidine kinase
MRPDPAPARRRSARLWNTTGMRIAALGAGLATSSAAIVFVIIYLGALGAMRSTLDGNIDNEFAEILSQGAATTPAAVEAAIRAAIAETPATVFYADVDANGQPIAGNLTLAVPPPGRHTIDAPRNQPFAPHVHALRVRVRSIEGGRLLVGVDASTLVELKILIRRSFLIGFGITLTIGMASGIAFGRRALARVESVSTAGRDIMGGDFTRRIPLSGSGDEFDQLAASINAMLARIESLMGDIRAVSDAIAHDLRSPLARLREGLEIALRDPGRMPAAVTEAIVQVDTALALSAAMLRLAQIETGARRAGFAPVDLTRLISDLVETFDTVIEDQGGRLTATIAAGLVVNGDAILLNQMLVNLIENAITHGGAVLTITVDATARQIVVTIADQGPGIPPDRRAEALRRFGRLDTARSDHGNGLGLPLAAAIAVLHHGRLTLENSDEAACNPGLTIVTTLPLFTRSAERVVV